VLLVVLVGSTIQTPAWSQMPARSIPSDAHFLSFEPYRTGDFNTARRAFASVSRVKTTEAVWLDSIPYHAMIGECMYQMGDLAGALEQYTAALQVYVRYPDWLLRLDFPPGLALSPKVVSNPPNWGTPTRVIRVAAMPDRVGSLEGKSDQENLQALQQGGVIAMRQLVLVNPQEIVRCMALALRRRAEILGPAGEHDALVNQVITSLTRRPAPPNHWSQAWISLNLGLAHAAKGKRDDAVSELQQSLLMAGMDHPLTSTALLELGKLAFRAGDFGSAGTYFLEATYSAGVLANDDITQCDVLAEAFRWATITHLVSGQAGPFQPLIPATEWARRTPSRVLEASLALTAAENMLALSDVQRGAALLERAASVMRRRECGQGEIGARYQFLSAHAAYLQGDLKRGATALANAMQYARKGGARWLFQIALVDRLFTAGSITTRQADTLYAQVLRDPQRLDWATDPLEALAVLMVPHAASYERWMLLALERKEKDLVLKVSEALRRHRFYTSLPLGGRLLNLRWTLEAPAESLTDAARLQRQDLLQRYPQYAQLSQQARNVRTELTGMPLAPDNADQLQHQSDLLARLLQMGDEQERILWAIAMGRDPHELVFPPATDVTVVQQQLQPRQRVFLFTSTSNATHAFLLGKESYDTWPLEAPAKVKANVVKLLQDFGQFDRNQPIGMKELTSVSWKDTAAEILKQLTGDAPADAWNEIDELIIVPDGLLWYVPFEALQIVRGTEKQALVDKVRIRYAPTLSLVVPDATPRKREARTIVVAGEVFPKSGPEAAQDLVQQLQAGDPNLIGVPVRPAPAPALLTKTADRLVVLQDLDNDPKAPFAWAPVPADRGKPTSTVAQWLLSPWGGPDQVVLPGFHTPAESALKRGGTGDDAFLAVCGLMAGGARTVLLSRWRDGGRTSHDLIREFVRELPYRSASAAWQRSIQLAVVSDVDFGREPRVKPPPTETNLKAEHPFFWSGYLLVDTGVEPKAE
jgi:tetratricopeptide (TPR) repeat protein